MESSEVRQKFEAFAKLEMGKYPSLYDLPDPFKLGPEDEYFEDAVAFAWESWRAGEIARWIPVEEKLPGKSGEYLVVESGDMEASSADFFIDLPNVEKSKWMTVRSFGQDCEERQLFTVTHWQPLPAAPEEKKP